MKNNQNKHNKLRFLNIIFGIPAFFISMFLPKHKTRIIFNSHFNTKFDYNSKYLFLYMMKCGYDVYFVINDDILREKLIKKYGDKFIETKTLKGKIFALKSKLWFISAFEMPVGGVFLKYFITIVHLTHGSLVKNVGLLEKDISFFKKIYYKCFVRTNISYSIATSEFFVDSTSKYIGIDKKNVLITGFPRNDALFLDNKKKFSTIDGKKYNILYAPTWRKDTETKLFPFENLDFDELNNFLELNDIVLHIRLHPVFEDILDKKILSKNIKLFSSKICDEIMDALVNFDALITDYSSIMYDFLLLDRPIIFLPYDYEEYKEKVGFAVEYSKIAAGQKPKTLDEFKYSLIDIKDIDTFSGSRKNISMICNKFHDGNCKRLIDVLIDKKIEPLYPFSS